jgi:SAM-dependent methyltransferase
MRLKGLVKFLFRDSPSVVIKKMRADWDLRARENPRHYVATLQDQWTDSEFFNSGSVWINHYILPDLQLICQGRPTSEMRILEIGCGAGRMTKPLSSVFGSIDAVDISAEMIAHATSALNDRSNVKFHVTSGADLSIFSDATFDFVFSALVFQHIPRRSIVQNYVKEVARVLRPGCVFKFQLQGFAISEEYADTWVGTGFTEKQVRQMADAYGFHVHSSQGAGTQDYWVTFVKE